MNSEAVLPCTKDYVKKAWKTGMDMLEHDALSEAAGYELQHLADVFYL